MRTLVKSSFLWQFVGGFLLGGIGFVATQPAAAATLHLASVAHSISL